MVSILGSPISSESKHEYLGITLDNHLTLAEQSAKALKKVSQRINLLKRVRSNLSSKTAATIYHTMIEPIMLYCAPIYLGIKLHHQKTAQSKSKASKIINSDMMKPIVSKLKDSSATKVFKHISGAKKEHLNSVPTLQPQNINTRQWLSANYP